MEAEAVLFLVALSHPWFQLIECENGDLQNNKIALVGSKITR